MTARFRVRETDYAEVDHHFCEEFVEMITAEGWEASAVLDGHWGIAYVLVRPRRTPREAAECAAIREVLDARDRDTAANAGRRWRELTNGRRTADARGDT